MVKHNALVKIMDMVQIVSELYKNIRDRVDFYDNLRFAGFSFSA